MTMTNDLRVAEILARGVTRLRATRIAINDAAKDELEAVADDESLDLQDHGDPRMADHQHEEASR